MKHTIKVAPSLLAADFSRLGSEIEKVEKAGCDSLHIDVMDGHFVPNITIGPFIVKAIRKLTRLPLDAHLMIEHPERFIEPFVEAGANHITVHAEACFGNLGEIIEVIHSHAITCGVSLKPQTPLSKIEPHLKDVDLVLLMTVNPGFGGQAFMSEVLPKIKDLRKSFERDIQVDGGINQETSKDAVKAGANVLVAGTYLFGHSDVRAAIREFKSL